MRTSTINPKLILFVAAFAAFLATFNETYLNVGFPTIMESFGVDLGTVQWLTTAYMLGAAVMVPVSAYLYRKVSTKPLFIVAVSLLIIGSIICSFAPNFAILLTGRIIQSLGTGVIVPIAMSMILDVAPRRRIGVYMGIMGAMVAVGPSVSIILSGIILTAFTWNVLFWVYGFLAILCLISAIACLKNVAKLTNPKLDVLSTILIGLALIGILYGVSTAFSGNILISIVSGVVGIILLALFVIRQKKGKNPLIHLEPLSIPPFTVGLIVNMLTLIIIFAFNIIIPLYLQQQLGVSALAASLALFPAILISGILSPVAGKIYDRHGPRLILPLGFIFVAVFAILLAIFFTTGSLLVFGLLYIPIMIGPALIVGPVQTYALSRLKPEMGPHGVVIFSTGFQIAGCIGSSVFAGVYSLFIATSLDLGFLATVIILTCVALAGLVLTIYLSISAKRDTNKDVPKTGIEEIGIGSMMLKGVYSVPVTASLLDAMNCMMEHKTSGIPVLTEDGKAAGFIVDGDIIRFMCGKESDTTTTFPSMYPLWHNRSTLDSQLKELANVNVMELASTKVIAVDIHDDVTKLFNILSDSRIKKIPVLDQGIVVGTVSRSDVMRKLLLTYSHA